MKSEMHYLGRLENLNKEFFVVKAVSVRTYGRI